MAVRRLGVAVQFALSIVMLVSCGVESGSKAMLIDLSIDEMSELMRGGTSSTDLVVHAVERARSLEHLHALITLDEAGALKRAGELDRSEEAHGPLHGIPIVVKDNIHVAGIANTAGTPGLKSFVPSQDSPVVATLRAAGAIVVAKANMHELAFGITSNNYAFGAVANPADARTFAGGSSGGTASAIAAGIVPAGLGSDTGGSVRIPAALTGIAGLRPTMGRYSQEGVTPISATRDTIGPMGRRVSDLVVLDEVICPDDPPVASVGLGELRLGVAREYFYSGLDRETELIVNGALERLESAGVTLVEAEVPDFAELIAQAGFPIAIYEAGRDMPRYLERYDAGISFEDLVGSIASPDVHGILSSVLEGGISQEVYQDALQAREELRSRYASYFREHRLDGMIFPTTPLPARPIEGSLETVELNGAQVPTFPTYIRNTDPGSLAGIPGLALPAGTTADGLPIGIEIDAPEGTDRRLLAMGLAIERLLGVAPPTH